MFHSVLIRLIFRLVTLGGYIPRNVHLPHWKYIGLLALILLLGCGGGEFAREQSAKTVSPDTSKPSPITVQRSDPNVESNSIRQVDFGDFAYNWYPPDYNVPPTGSRIILKNGKMDTGFGYGREPREFLLRDVEYGDLTGDGKEEAVVVLQVITSGTSRPSLIFVYGSFGGRVKKLWVYQTGDRWNYGYHNATVKDRQLIIERYKPNVMEYGGEEHDLSSSNTYIRSYFKWNGKDFVETKTEETPADSNDKSPWVVR